MRLINADALKKSIIDWYCDPERCNNYYGVKCRACPLDDALSAIDDAPTVGGWISVQDGLPEKNGRYLCRYEQEVYGEVCRCTDFGIFDSNIGEKGDWFVGKVTHWMPLLNRRKRGDVE